MLVRRRPDTAVSALVAPGNPRLGVLLPYTPLHHLLFAPVPGAPGDRAPRRPRHDERQPDRRAHLLRRRGRPQAAGRPRRRLAAARPPHPRPLRRLGAPGRPGHRRRAAAAALPRLRAAPGPPALRGRADAGRGRRAQEHVLPGVGTRRLHEPAHRRHGQPRDVGRLRALGRPALRPLRHRPADGRRRPPRLPDAPLGRRPGRRAVEEVQHHHAHVASVMAEHGLAPDRAVIGWPSTAPATGPTAPSGAARCSSPATRASPASPTCVRCPCRGGRRRPPARRAALAHLWAAGLDWAADLPPVAAAAPEERRVLAPARARRRLRGHLEHGTAVRRGELAAGCAPEATYEAQAAMELQWVAESHFDANPGRRRLLLRPDRGGDLVDAAPAPVLRSWWRTDGPASSRVPWPRDSTPPWPVSPPTPPRQRPHGPCHSGAQRGGLPELAAPRPDPTPSRGRGFDVLTHQLVPANDGGLALGQAAVVGFRAQGAAGGMMTTVALRRTKTTAPHRGRPPADLAAAALALARRFAAGATLWCVAPAWPSHARHVAVEFVHPVIVGRAPSGRERRRRAAADTVRCWPVLVMSCSSSVRPRTRWRSTCWPGPRPGA